VMVASMGMLPLCRGKRVERQGQRSVGRSGRLCTHPKPKPTSALIPQMAA
jgi:hypothetical protein